jgi:hypothetical protein
VGVDRRRRHNLQLLARRRPRCLIWRRGCMTCRHGEVTRHGQATEYVKGWGVSGLPFESGHVLALRVFPENDFSPYRTIWHRDPGGQWPIYLDGQRLDTACPRYYGPAYTHIGHAQIDLEWTGPASLRVTMDPSPRVDPHSRASADPAPPQRGQPPAAPVDLAIQPPPASPRTHRPAHPRHGRHPHVRNDAQRARRDPHAPAHVLHRPGNRGPRR